MRRAFVFAVASFAGWIAPVASAAPPPDASALEFFEAKVRPVLANRCGTCHGADKSKAGLRLDSRESILKGGETGPAAVPGKPDESLLIEAVNYGDAVQMPPKSRLPEAEVKTLTRWVEMGMPWTPGSAASASPAAKSAFDLNARKAAHWAWQPVKATPPPAVQDSGWPADPVDRFILAKLEEKRLKPAPDASRRTLFRRLSFDITGLPPTPEEVEAFVADPSPDAVEKVVDRLLASPGFGVRWGRHWLDLVRYAETRGHEFDPAIPNAWRYRDYVVNALNDDVPYNKFLTEHIAGDLVPSPRVDPKTGANLSVLGTGFFLLGEEVHSPVDVRADETDRMDNRVDVMCKTFLGLTVACARCHDHKFDAISQRDYYALSGFLISSPYRQVRFSTWGREKAVAEALQAQRDAARTRVLALTARAIKTSVDRLEDDLLDARAFLTGCACDERRHGHEPDPARFKPWAEELTRARTEPSNPFHAYALQAQSDRPHPPGPVEPAGLASFDLPAVKGQALVEFGKIDTLDRWQDGFAFGLRPARPGDVLASASLTGVPGLVTTAAARRDPAFRHLEPEPGNQSDHGRLGSWERAGQTLRTPEFTLATGKLWYLARGAGRVYAAMNSHLIIAGPLHGALLTEWTDGQKGWRWVRHDLSAYAGHRGHLEFSPAGGADLEIAAVVEAENEPPLSGDSCRTLPLVIRNARPSPEPLAAAYREAFSELTRRLETDSLATSSEPEAFARLADWVVRHPTLLGGRELKEAIAHEFNVLRAAEESLARQVAGTGATALALSEGNGVDEKLLIRGSSKTPGPDVPRRFLEAIAGDRPISAPGSGRLALAHQMLDETNPFARRVIVNRVWHHLFGRGIVASVDNFGVLGERPTHPELLDHLADRFVKDGWSLKRLIRTLVLTRTYAMSSKPDPEAEKLDVSNALWHRMQVRRLEGEPIRDAILAVSGRLDERLGGPGMPVHLTAFMQGRGRPGQEGPLDGAGRRSIYLEIRRNFLAPMMLAFDAPIPFSTVGRRNVSNVPSQALILMNDPFVASQAMLWAKSEISSSARSPADRIDSMYRRAFARPARPDETANAISFLEGQGAELKMPAGAWKNDPGPWADLAHVLFNAKEFVFLD